MSEWKAQPIFDSGHTTGDVDIVADGGVVIATDADQHTARDVITAHNVQHIEALAQVARLTGERAQMESQRDTWADVANGFMHERNAVRSLLQEIVDAYGMGSTPEAFARHIEEPIMLARKALSAAAAARPTAGLGGEPKEG